MKYLISYIFLLLTPILVVAEENRNFIMLGKARSDGEIVKAKGLFKSLMIGHQQAISHNREESFISHITAKIKNKIILDVSTSPSLGSNPKIKYKFKDIGHPKSIEYIITDNKSNTKELSFDIKRKCSIKSKKEKVEYLNNYQSVNFRKTNPKAWKARTYKEAVNELYGLIESPIKNKINIESPDSIVCPDFYVSISSNEDLESIAIFVLELSHPTIAVFSIPPNSIIDYQIKTQVKYPKYSYIVIGKGRNGKFYKTMKTGKVERFSDACL